MKQRTEIQAATSIVHWPGRDTEACDEHRTALNRVASAMGIPEPSSTAIAYDVQCENCRNEVLKGARRDSK